VESGDYQLIIAGTTYTRERNYSWGGMSPSFRIERPDTVVLVWPPERDPGMATYWVGKSYTLEWNCTGSFNGNVDIKHLKNGVNIENIAIRIPCSNRRFTWVPGGDCRGTMVPEGEHAIRVERSDDYRSFSRSAPFKLQIPHIWIHSQRGGDVVRNGTQATITISTEEIPIGHTLIFELMKGGVLWMGIVCYPSSSEHGMKSYTWYVGAEPSSTERLSGHPRYNMGGPPLPPAGDDYQIRIRSDQCPLISVLSPRFRIE
jgi:hypothetical protein